MRKYKVIFDIEITEDGHSSKASILGKPNSEQFMNINRILLNDWPEIAAHYNLQISGSKNQNLPNPKADIMDIARIFEVDNQQVLVFAGSDAEVGLSTRMVTILDGVFDGALWAHKDMESMFHSLYEWNNESVAEALKSLKKLREVKTNHGQNSQS